MESSNFHNSGRREHLKMIRKERRRELSAVTTNNSISKSGKLKRMAEILVKYKRMLKQAEFGNLYVSNQN